MLQLRNLLASSKILSSQNSMQRYCRMRSRRPPDNPRSLFKASWYTTAMCSNLSLLGRVV